MTLDQAFYKTSSTSSSIDSRNCQTSGASPAEPGGLPLTLAESAFVAFASTLMAIVISLALSRAILDLAEQTLLHVTIPMQFSMSGLALLCGDALVVMLMVLLTLAYSLRKSVRDAIAYE